MFNKSTEKLIFEKTILWLASLIIEVLDSKEEYPDFQSTTESYRWKELEKIVWAWRDEIILLARQIERNNKLRENKIEK